MGCNTYTDQPFVVLGAPVDCATTFRSGTRMGPNAIRDASMMLTDGVHALYPGDILSFTGDAGDMGIPSGNHSAAIKTIRDDYSNFRGKNVITLGGHHGITYPILQSLSCVHGKNEIAVIHFDAHCDTWQDHFGERHGHGTWLYDAIQEKLVNPSKVVSIGIRSPSDRESRRYLTNRGGRTVTSREAMGHQTAVMADILRSIIGNSPCYMSLDIDCLDPAYAPGTGTPEIAGLTSMWLSALLDDLAGLNFIGMDCVEVAPPYDCSQITALAGATFAWQYLSFMVYRHQKILA